MSHERAGTRVAAFLSSWLLYGILFGGLAIAGLYGGIWIYTNVREFAAHTTFRTISPVVESDTRPVKIVEQPNEPDGIVSEPQDSNPAPVSVVYPDIKNLEPVNILFLGIDQRAGESAACRTDTMILVSINPKDKSVSLLSIPRDLWVRIPLLNHEYGKITTAHYWGEIEKYPGGGPALAMKTVYNTIGVRPHYYVRLNFTGFERIIDTIGGIDINVPETIDDAKYPDNNYGVERLYIPAGQHHFDGAMALKYARTRYGSDDFSRMDRQKQIIAAVRDRVLGLENLPQLIGQLPQLYRDMGDSLQTDIPVDLMVQLANWALEIDRDHIHADSIDRRMVTDDTRADGMQVLILDQTKARPIIDNLFRVPTPQAESQETSAVEKLEQEQARIVVYNGTPFKGLAGSVSDFIEKQGLEVAEPQNAASFDQEYTVLNVYNDKPFTVDWLINVFNVSPDHVFYRSMEASDVDISLVIGQDFPVDEFR
ncbi:MAG: LCP family protein [Anaerolineae bacterium]|nr:LCP family protein [Anaerolineae bacterium]